VTSSIPANKFYKPGGTLILAQGDVVGRIKEKGSDSLGRWSWIKLVGRNQCLITLILAYQVCVRPTNITGTTAYHQQESLLCQKGARKQNQASYFTKILTDLCASEKCVRNPWFLLGTSTSRWRNALAWHGLFSSHSLFDILFQRNSHLPEPHTYVCGSTRIDYTLITPDLVDTV
jgi:hypothetical protein